MVLSTKGTFAYLAFGLPETHSASLVFGTKFFVDYPALLTAYCWCEFFFFLASLFNTETGSAVRE